jgi:hypothetical protein
MRSRDSHQCQHERDEENHRMTPIADLKITCDHQTDDYKNSSRRSGARTLHSERAKSFLVNPPHLAKAPVHARVDRVSTVAENGIDGRERRARGRRSSKDCATAAWPPTAS